MQVCWAVLNKEIKRENPIYHPPATTSVFKPVRGRSGKPRILSKEEYYEKLNQTGNIQNPRSYGGN